MPLDLNLPGGNRIQSLTYAVVFLSIVFTSVLSFLIERTFISKIYAVLFRRFGRETEPIQFPLETTGQ
jgi:hypothetical protein